MRIAVAGGTGLTGGHVVDVARERGHDTVLLARSRGVELLSGAGLPRALVGVDAVIDVSNVTTLRADESISFFAGATRSLLAAERAAGVAHHIALSIVGADAAPEGYYAGKLAQERLVAAGPVPWTIQRATQFHEFAAQMYVRAAAGPLRFALRARTQPIAAREVAEHLVSRAQEGPAGRATDLGGPREESLADMMRAYARAIGHCGWMPPLSLPGAMGRAQRSGALLAGPDAVRGRQTFAEWLDALPDA
ncbi:SDR family oxidoreductase [Microbacterium sp. NPDC055910]|uniref:SDR family oxidoreductase n=1 Tax=Microbacterium sp. NPDC055910 TaxID=3345659 RepID=UPI0035DE4D3B